jgi:diguanylate cyclase (GGDEF)-like protein
VEDEKELLNYETTHDADLRIWRRRLAVPLLAKIMRNSPNWSVVMADIDGFRNVNSTYGTQTADKVLLILTERLKTLSGKWQMELIRFAGDEFLFLVPDLLLKADHPAIQEILKAFADPIILDNIFLKLSASVGIALPDSSNEAEHLIANAEDAMVEARRRGKNQIFIYCDELKERAAEEHKISEKLLDAIENDKLYMLYQPKVDVKTKQVNGYEALVRMKGSDIGPSKFIPVAEKNGWIWRIGRITSELTIRQMAVWRGLGYPLQPVSINFSSRQVSDSEYIPYLEELMRRYNIPSNLLEIEITESVFLDKTAHAEKLIECFRKAGLRLVMDDFGTGYSALGYLTYIPVDTIKLDRSLVTNYLIQGHDSIIRDVINLSHDLGKVMLVEGVETSWQYERLKEFGADTIQGYYFSKPLGPKEAISFHTAI